MKPRQKCVQVTLTLSLSHSVTLHTQTGIDIALHVGQTLGSKLGARMQDGPGLLEKLTNAGILVRAARIR